MKGVGEYQIRTSIESRRKILAALANGGWVRYRDIAAKAGVGTTTASKFLKSMEEAGEVEKKVDLAGGEYPYPVLYRLTPKGLDALKTFLRQEAAERTPACDLTESVREKLLKRIEETIGHIAPGLEAKHGSRLKAILAMYAAAATPGFLEPLEQASQKLNALSEAIAEGLNVAVDPPAEKAEEKDAVGDGIISMLGHIPKAPTCRERVAETGKMAIVITLDISKADMPPEEKREALFWGLAFGALREEAEKA